METKQYKSVFLPKKLVVKTTDKAILWKLPEMKGETDKYFWVSRKFVHPVGKDFVVNYEENFQFTVFEQIKNEQGNFERVNPQEVTGEELKGIFIKYDPKIEEAYWRWKVKNEVTPGSVNTSQYKEEKKEPSVLKCEFRKAIADQFLKLLDSSNSKKRFGWLKEWRMNGGQQNLNSGKNYRGINRLVLALKAYEKGYSDPRWITFNGLKDYKRAYIKKGEHGTQVEYWAAVKRNPIYDEMTKKMKRFFTISEMNQYLKNHPEEKNNDFHIFPKYAMVFNAEQCTGLPEYVPQVTNSEVTQSDLVTKISESMGVKIINHKESDECYYSPLEDVIHLPEQTAFRDDYAYNATALHELAHSTGATNRLDRNLQNYFGSSDYAFEELVAEMTSAMVAASLPTQEESLNQYLEKHAENHQAYVKSWMNAIEKDVDVLPRALKLAELSTDFMELHGGLISLDEYNKLHQYEKPVIADETTGRLFVTELQKDNVLNCENRSKQEDFKESVRNLQRKFNVDGKFFGSSITSPLTDEMYWEVQKYKETLQKQSDDEEYTHKVSL